MEVRRCILSRMRTCESLSKFQRRSTPLPFGRYLVETVLARTGSEKVAVLWCERRSNYWKLWPAVDLWGVSRNALTYAGPYPVICHPPCGPWGKYRSVSKESKLHGAAAMHFVHKWGGVVEHPVGSSLFKDLGDHGRIEIVNQSDYGHV